MPGIIIGTDTCFPCCKPKPPPIQTFWWDWFIDGSVYEYFYYRYSTPWSDWTGADREAYTLGQNKGTVDVTQLVTRDIQYPPGTGSPGSQLVAYELVPIWQGGANAGPGTNSSGRLAPLVPVNGIYTIDAINAGMQAAFRIAYDFMASHYPPAITTPGWPGYSL